MKNLLKFLKLLILINITAALVGLNVTLHRKHLKLIEGSMDPTTDPCENFYQYACGNWDKMHNNISKYQDYYNMIEYNTNKEMMKLLAPDEKSMNTEPKFVTTVRAYYQSCVAVKHVRLVEYLKWLEATEDINMMLTESSAKSKNFNIQFDWLKYLAIMNKYGLSGIFLEETYYKSLGILKLTKPERAEGFTKLTFVYFDYIDLRTSTTENQRTFNIKWKDFSNFENELEKLHKYVNGTRITFTLATLSELPWLYRYVNMLLQNTRFPHKSIDLEIFVNDMDYVTQLYKFLQKYDQDFLCEYLKIRFLYHLLHVSFPLNTTPESCALKARTYMYLATDYLFERQHVDLVESIPKIHTMFSNIKAHYAKLLLANPNGFNSNVMKFLLDKLNSTQLMVGLLPRNNTQQQLETLYSCLNFSQSGSQSYYGNQMELLKFNTNGTHLMQIQMIEDPTKYIEYSKRVSPYYITSWNIVVLPITTLQMPIYDAGLSDFFAYSSLGYTLGHELTHAIDTGGIKRDAKGRMTDDYHKVINANQKYQRNLACLRRLNSGEVDEKIADVTGFRVAFQTYFELNPQIRLKKLCVNGMKLPMDKLFFLNYAQFRCSTLKETSFEDKSHGTDEDRTIDSISHFSEFTKTFECPKYTDMHVLEPCQLWRK